MRRLHVLTLAVPMPLLACCAGKCVPIDVPPAQAVSEDDRVARQVGRLLSSDADAVRAAEASLTRLDADGRKALEAQAKRIPNEKDPRWLRVLDENQMLPDLSVDERIDLWLWACSRPEKWIVMKAQDRLLVLAREHPEAFIARLSAPGEGREILVIALAHAGRRDAVPVVLEIYKNPTNAREQKAAAEALAILAGEERRPRADGTPEEKARDAARLEAWWKQTEGSDMEEERVVPREEPAVPREQTDARR